MEVEYTPISSCPEGLTDKDTYPVKTFIAVVMLLALVSPVHASPRNYALWDCGGGLEVAAGKWLQFSSTRRNDYPAKGTFKWGNGKMLVNGKACVALSDKQQEIKSCAEGQEGSCEVLKSNWEMTPEQIKHAVEKWKKNWPGRTFKKAE